MVISRASLVATLTAAVILAVPVSPAFAHPSSGEHATRHYDVYAEGRLDPVDVGAMLEALYEQLVDHFRQAPKERLRVEVYSTNEAFNAALARDRVPEPGSGGYYSPRTRKAYLWKQPTDYFTRQLILHEATHQFHYLAVTANSTPTSGGWYIEGIAEYFGMHNWDGVTLQTGVIPAVSQEDYPRQALDQYDKMQDFKQVLLGKESIDRPLAWSLIHFCMNHEKLQKPFRKLMQSYDRRADALGAWTQLVGQPSKEFLALWRDWIATHQQSFRSVWICWQERGDAIEGKSQVNALAVLRGVPELFSVALDPQGETFKAGLCFGYRSTSDFYLVQVISGGAARVVKKTADGWQVILRRDCPPVLDGDRHVISLVQKKSGCVVAINGVIIGAYQAPGGVGLNVDACRVMFQVRER